MIEFALKIACKELQTRCVHSSIGSTANIGIVFQEKNVAYFSGVNLGDSFSYAVILDQNNNPRLVEQLNTLHNPHNEKEAKRILSKGGAIAIDPSDNVLKLKQPMVGLIPLTRGFGDIDFHPVGFSPIPEMYFQPYPVLENEKALFIVASDGINPIADPEKLKVLIAECIKSQKPIAHALTKAGISSGDNVSVALAYLSAHPISIAVFDGHGITLGDTISHELSEYFYEALEKAIKYVLTPGRLDALRKDEKNYASIKSSFEEIASESKGFDEKPHAQKVDLPISFKENPEEDCCQLIFSHKKMIEVAEKKGIKDKQGKHFITYYKGDNPEKVLELTESLSKEIHFMLKQQQKSQSDVASVSAEVSAKSVMDEGREPSPQAMAERAEEAPSQAMVIQEQKKDFGIPAAVSPQSLPAIATPHKRDASASEGWNPGLFNRPSGEVIKKAKAADPRTEQRCCNIL